MYLEQIEESKVEPEVVETKKNEIFDSEIVREELSEINKLQTSIYGKMLVWFSKSY